MNKINWEREKDKLEELIKDRVSFTEIARMYGYKNGYFIKRKAIQLGIKIYNKKTGKYYEYEQPIFKCKYCGKEFTDKHKLGGHVTYCTQNPKLRNNLKNTENARKNIKHIYQQEECFCRYCGKKVENNGCLAIHEQSCEHNPNRTKCPNRIGNGGASNGHVAWNKNKTMLDDERIRKATLKRKKSLEEGKFIIVGKPHSDKTKLILREKMIKHIKDTSGGFGQNFSVKGCEYIDELNKKNNWNLVHAKNGGEKEVCGYFLDGYDKNLNIAFEYDEPRHYKDVYNNVLCEKDLKRQQEIINELGCTFYRYNEKIKKFYLAGGQDG